MISGSCDTDDWCNGSFVFQKKEEEKKNTNPVGHLIVDRLIVVKEKQHPQHIAIFDYNWFIVQHLD